MSSPCIGRVQAPLLSNGLFAVPSWVQLFVCFWPFTPLELVPRGRVSASTSPAQVTQANAPGRRRMRDGAGLPGKPLHMGTAATKGLPPYVFRGKRVGRPCDAGHRAFFIRRPWRDNYVKQICAFAWERTSITGFTYYSKYLEAVGTCGFRLWKTLWKLWITFRICIAMQSYGNCFTPGRTPEPPANPRAGRTGRPFPGPEKVGLYAAYSP